MKPSVRTALGEIVKSVTIGNSALFGVARTPNSRASTFLSQASVIVSGHVGTYGGSMGFDGTQILLVAAWKCWSHEKSERAQNWPTTRGLFSAQEKPNNADALLTKQRKQKVAWTTTQQGIYLVNSWIRSSLLGYFMSVYGNFWTPTSTIDYRCEDGSFLVSASCGTISDPEWLSSSETGVNPGISSRKKHLSDWARRQKAIGGIYFTKKWRAETQQPDLRFGVFKSRLKSCTFKCIYQLNSSCFGGDHRGFLKEIVKT